MSAVTTACIPSRIRFLLKVTIMKSSLAFQNTFQGLGKSALKIQLCDHLYNLIVDPKPAVICRVSFPNPVSQQAPLYLTS